MSQEAHVRDVLKTWELTDCRPLAVPGVPTKIELPIEEPDAEPDPEDVHRAQKLQQDRCVDLVKYENKTRYYVCTIENFVNDDERTKKQHYWKEYGY